MMIKLDGSPLLREQVVGFLHNLPPKLCDLLIEGEDYSYHRDSENGDYYLFFYESTDDYGHHYRFCNFRVVFKIMEVGLVSATYFSNHMWYIDENGNHTIPPPRERFEEYPIDLRNVDISDWDEDFTRVFYFWIETNLLR